MHLFWSDAVVLAVGMVVGAAMVLAMTRARSRKFAQTAQPQTEGVVKARAFELVDKTGKVRASLGFVVFGLTKEEPCLNLLDKDGKVCASLGVVENEPSLALLEHGRVRAGLRVSGDGPALNLMDKDGKERAGLGIIGPDGVAGGLRLLEKDGRVRAAFGVWGDEAMLTLYDKASNVLWKAP